ncbi:SDR family oxidoreductase [Photobacterium sanguinicancri]|uniref:SDR family oxidoreductase n=1 Tax=Photobacterium sanguinicancri TaxID=875932 RepID=UPI002480A83A|nr:SDR family oxidoreductase [Photobacterium sanguinicancri]
MGKAKCILVVGSTGYLGSHIIKRLLGEQADFKAVARSKNKLLALGVKESQIIEAQVTNPDELTGICDGIDIVISCLGITKQRDGLSYQAVDYQANLNLLCEAERAGVRKFTYVSAFNAQKYPAVRLLKAKEAFAKRLLASEKLTPCVIRPNGFFSDISDIFNMARSGRVYLFGRGHLKLNPIHGADLARFCLEAISKEQQEIDVGGPEILSVKAIAQIAFTAQNKPVKITYLPDWLRVFLVAIVKRLPVKWGGPAEFFLTLMGEDAIAPSYGEHRLVDFFARLEK